MGETEMLPENAAGPAAPQAAEVVIGLATHNNAGTVGAVVQAATQGLARLGGARGVVLQADLGSTDGTAEAARAAATAVPLDLLPAPAAPPGSPAPAPGRSAALRQLFEAARERGARALVILDPDAGPLAPEALDWLAGPVLRQEVEFMGPWYSRPRFAGAMTSSIVYPFTRALYGRRLRFPAGGEFAAGPRFLEHCLAHATWGADPTRLGVDLWLAHRALQGGFKLGQACLGSRAPAAGDGDTDLSGVLARVLGTLFAEAERHPQWQKVRGSEPVERYGTPPAPDADAAPVDLKRTLDSFRLGQEHLKVVWGAVLPPLTLLELRKLARVADAAFRLPDTLWARLVYDFTLAYHARSMSREHLLAAFAPLYLGWLGSFVAEMTPAEPARAERRIEELCLRFEAEKPYLISRWRWPDRFNP